MSKLVSSNSFVPRRPFSLVFGVSYFWVAVVAVVAR